MSEYRFYIFNNRIRYYNSFKEAREAIKHIYNNEYTALGIQKNQTFSCDLLIKSGGKYTISQDYTKSDIFKNDGLISQNSIKILQREFNITEG